MAKTKKNSSKAKKALAVPVAPVPKVRPSPMEGVIETVAAQPGYELRFTITAKQIADAKAAGREVSKRVEPGGYTLQVVAWQTMFFEDKDMPVTYPLVWESDGRGHQGLFDWDETSMQTDFYGVMQDDQPELYFNGKPAFSFTPADSAPRRKAFPLIPHIQAPLSI